MILIINPENAEPEEITGKSSYNKLITDRVPQALQIASLLIFIMITIGSILLKNVKDLHISEISNISEK